MNSILRWYLCLACFVVLPGQGANGNQLFKMCGKWRHGSQQPRIVFNVTRGCEGVRVSANVSTLYVSGRFTNSCENNTNNSLSHKLTGFEIPFCLTWDPYLQSLVLNINGENGTSYSVCGPEPLRDQCCDLSPDNNWNASGDYGIVNGSIRGDVIKEYLQESYVFEGSKEDCVKSFCSSMDQNPDWPKTIERVLMKSGRAGPSDLPCLQSFVLHIEEDFGGETLHLTNSRALLPELVPSVRLPACLLPPGKNASKVVCIYYNSSVFRDMSTDPQSASVGNEVVAISVEDEVIINLPEPVRIMFRHQNKTGMKTKCVYWDPKKDPTVHWRSDGCQTHWRSPLETECRCNHLTYFALLLEVEQQTVVRHLQALTWITALGCSISTVSCLALIILMSTRRKKGKEQSSYIHCNLVAAMLLLSLFFLFTGIVANLEMEAVCQVYGAVLHYALLCTFTWMAMEVLNTFWLVYMVMKVQLRHRLLAVLGFGVPVIPVITMLLTNMYGQRKISDDMGNFYSMCWIKADGGFLAHCIINVGFFLLVFCSGSLMLCLVLRQIRRRKEWKDGGRMFFSILGLSFLFGSSWALGFLGFGALVELVHFLFCINSLQGFFLLVRFWVLEWLRKREDTAEKYNSSSTGQHMLASSERS